MLKVNCDKVNEVVWLYDIGMGIERERGDESRRGSLIVYSNIRNTT